MPIKATYEISASRLREELKVLGMDYRGSRSDLVSRLQQAGVYEINDSVPARPPKIDRTCDYPNHESILIGRGANIESASDEKIVVCNTPKSKPLLVGDFKTHKLQINDCINLQESSVNATLEGNEGDLRREGSQLYMYRCTDVHPGWYPLQFGPVIII